MRATQRTAIFYSSGLLYNRQYFRTPTVGIASFRCLIKFLNGMGDFGRVNAHQPRWKSLPGLRESDTHKRVCLLCWKQSRNLFEDSEWHCVFSCPVGNACRKRFQLALSNLQNLAEHIETEKDIFLKFRRNA